MENVKLNRAGDGVIILDQSLLPREEKYIELGTLPRMREAIESLRVRGAPAIGIFAGYAMAALARQEAMSQSDGRDEAGKAQEAFMQKLRVCGDELKSSRPTAVNLSWAVDRVTGAARAAIREAKSAGLSEFRLRATEAMRAEAVAIHREDEAMCEAIALLGMEELRRISRDGGLDNLGILTHCNAGPLATSRYGTALGPIIMAQERGLCSDEGEIKLRVFADETRPLLQGARLTSYELQRAGVDVTLICDNMAQTVMKNGWVQACFVGCDRVAANGDVANKIGTSGVAVIARHYGIPFYVLGPTSTVDMGCPSGEEIPIEERDPDEIRVKFYSEPMAPAGVKCFNPAFDVTDNGLITAIITEKGILRPPFDRSIAAVMEKKRNG